jgi:hypothetical protein
MDALTIPTNLKTHNSNSTHFDSTYNIQSFTNILTTRKDEFQDATTLV